jgi:hypothetical protein
MTDCAACHTARVQPLSIRPLLTEGVITPIVTFDPSVPEAARASWTERLEKEIEAADIRLVPPGHELSLEVDIHVRIDIEEGRTDAGTVYHVARGSADVRRLRAHVEVVAPLAVSPDRAEAVSAALDRLLLPVEDAIAW